MPVACSEKSGCCVTKGISYSSSRAFVLNFLPVRLKIHNQAVEFQEDGDTLPSLVLIEGLSGLRTYQKMLKLTNIN